MKFFTSVNYFFLIIGILMLSSCNLEQKPVYVLDKPADLIPEETMVNILLKVHLTETMLLESGIPYDSAKILYEKVYEDDILAEFDVADTTYFKSYQFYLSNPYNMEDLYAAVIDSLNIRKKLHKLEIN